MLHIKVSNELVRSTETRDHPIESRDKVDQYDRNYAVKILEVENIFGMNMEIGIKMREILLICLLSP